MKLQLYIGVLIYMFLSSAVAAKIGITTISTASLVFFVIPILQRFYLNPKKVFNKEFLPELRIIILGVVVCILKYFLSDFDLARDTFFLVIITMLMSILLGKQSNKSRFIIRNLILFFFISECLLAIYEKIVGINIFPYLFDESIIEFRERNDYAFRSTAFLGHPLHNAAIVSMIMGFIIVSNLKPFYKGILFILGFTAILCFNARGAILIWAVTAMISFYYLIKDKKNGKIPSYAIFIFSIISLTAIFYLIQQGFGDRLISSGVNDKSALSRIDVFEAFSFLNSDALIFGNSSYYLLVMNRLGAAGVENPYIVLILNYGIPVFILLIFSYYSWLKKTFKQLTKPEKVIIFLSYIVACSTSPILSVSTPWMFFVFCSNSFLSNQSIVYKNKHHLKLNMNQYKDNILSKKNKYDLL